MIEAWRNRFTIRQFTLDHDRPVTFILSQISNCIQDVLKIPDRLYPNTMVYLAPSATLIKTEDGFLPLMQENPRIPSFMPIARELLKQRGEWQSGEKPNIFYLIYRWAVALWFFITLVISVVDLKHPNASAAFRAKWLIYLTDWGYTLCALQALTAAVMLSTCMLAPRLRSMPNLQDNALKLSKLYWVTNVMATDVALGITILYWSLIYNEETMKLDAMNFMVHANNSILMMIDLFMVSHPIRLCHFIYPVVFGLCYSIFSAIYYFAGGLSKEGNSYIYAILKWSEPGKATLVCLVVLGFIAFIHCLVWGLHKLRIWLHSKCHQRVSEVGEVAADDSTSSSGKRGYDNEGLSSDNV